MVTFERNHYFTGRTSELEHVRQQFRESGKDHHRIALHGLGGVGKTQFALEYLFRFRQHYNHCFWITGSERTSYMSGLAMIGETLKFPRSRPTLTSEAFASELLRWLPQQASGWLLVIDELENADVLKDLMPSGTPCSHILITTRNANLRSLPAQTYNLKELSVDEAAQLLVIRTMPDEDDISPNVRNEARMIVEQLGCLPLAIEQAAGYIQQSVDGIFDFRSTYRLNEQRILGHRRVSLEYPHSVSTTWLLSFERLRDKYPDALILLNLFAFLNPDEILIDFLRAGTRSLDGPIRSLVADPYIFNGLVASLGDYSLIRPYQGNKVLSMHRLVQAVIKDRLSPEERIRWRNITLNICASAFPPILEKEISLHRRFHRQVMACINGTDVEDSELAAEMMSRLGWYWDREARYSDAAALYERSIAMYQNCQIAENECPYIVTDRLGWTYMRQGRKAEALTLFQQSFTALTRILGDEHDRTLSCQRNYAVVLLTRGESVKGMSMLEEACEKQRKSSETMILGHTQRCVSSHRPTWIKVGVKKQ